MTSEEQLKVLLVILGKRVPYCCLQLPCEGVEREVLIQSVSGVQ